MLATASPYTITWEKLPDDFVLPDDPVDNINQPTLAAALTESLQLAGKLPATALTPTNYGICAKVNDRFVVKAPDWAFIPHITVDRAEVFRSYTPHLQGEIPAIVLEFLSDTDGTEYSVKETYPPGKYFYYEQILQVPNYGIFEPVTGQLELYRLQESGQYKLTAPDEEGRFWIPEMQLFLGVWQGSRENRPGYWLRWWDEQGNLLLWGTERVALEQQRTEQERQRAEQERQRADRLLAQLRAAGIEPED
ncbi:Uma2 family endonuclease [Trichothermofontia sichuanensis B231]|uniref:Uma2 family endonuclease n=1 Tax=Trichothermofontia sichuanensis TaxID=3045816 RepID=UPI002246095E|nr:Uma2 family endonuclease [Trichothermofontia sichuanensis]UZQ54148.1 Uma2 family endonuclease [Trichothermofontia sichuanensis B231]